MSCADPPQGRRDTCAVVVEEGAAGWRKLRPRMSLMAAAGRANLWSKGPFSESRGLILAPHFEAQYGYQ